MRPLPLFWFTLAMVLVIVSSNVLVQYPLNDWITWGAITYPFAFLVTDLANRFFGPRFARVVVYAGFVIAVALSAYYAAAHRRCVRQRVPGRRAAGREDIRLAAAAHLVATAARVHFVRLGGGHRVFFTLAFTGRTCPG
jgi:hypothetical protein